MSKNNKITNFGFAKVSWEEKQRKVSRVFHSVATKYDLMNDLMSFGIHRLWKKITINKAFIRKDDIILDLAGGTGDLAYKFCQLIDDGKVVLSDINSSMLKIGKKKLINKGCVGNIEYVQANAECLPFADNYFNCITISFGLRNITDQIAALKSMYRVLKPGGKLLILEFSKPIVPLLSAAYDKYSFKFIPFLGKIIHQDYQSYKYLVESIRQHPDQNTLKEMILDAAFDKVQYQNITGGIVALHIGYKY